jgi:hypothetical protein
MRRIQVAARGGGECARTGTLRHVGLAEVAIAIESITGTETNPITGCCFTSPHWNKGWEIGPVVFPEKAQQVLFAQQFGLQLSWLGALDRMHESVGSCNGLIAIASATANRIGTVLRITLMLAQKDRASTA